MRFWATLALLVLSASAITAQATPRRDKPINILTFNCNATYSDGMFSEIHFERLADGTIQGVLNNFANQKDGTKKYLWGEYLFDLEIGNDFVLGHTGDPRGVIYNFSLTKSKDRATRGKWVFSQGDLAIKSTTTLLNCINP